MDELSNIKVFIEAVEAGSFSAASRNNGASVSTIARQIKQLEDELGVRLLQRNTRNQSLTEAGRTFLDRAKVIIKELNITKSDIRNYSEDVRGTLRVCLRNPSATTLVIPALPLFFEKFPDIHLDIQISDERLDLISKEIDLAVWSGSLPDNDFITKTITRSMRIVCASPVYLEKHGTPQVPSDLASHQCLQYKQKSYGNHWYFQDSEGQQEISIRGTLSSDDGLVLLTAALNHLGIIMINDITVAQYVKSGQLVRLFENYAARPNLGEFPIHVVYPSRKGLSKKARVFIDFLAQVYY